MIQVKDTTKEIAQQLMMMRLMTTKEIAQQLMMMMRLMKEATGKNIGIDHLQGSINVEERGLGRRLAQMIVGSSMVIGIDAECKLHETCSKVVIMKLVSSSCTISVLGYLTRLLLSRRVYLCMEEKPGLLALDTSHDQSQPRVLIK
jgi:hypothetical protein